MNNMRFFNTCLQLIFALAFLSLQSCGDDDLPLPENEEELITTFTMTFTNIENTSDLVVAQFRDLDGDGGMEPVYEQPTFIAGETYNATIELLNESVNPAINISQEVETEGNAHQFFFGSSNTAMFTFAYTDADDNGKPIGLNTQWFMNEMGSGSLVVTLRHGLNKDGEGVSGGDITNAAGETDIEISFDAIIED